jgi:hypothetical protein
LIAICALLVTTLCARGADLLGEPCRAANVLSTRLVKSGGKEWFALANMNEVSHCELIFIDPATNTGQLFRAPAGAGAWALKQVRDDLLIVGTFYDGKFMVFDLKQKKFTKVIPFAGEEYIWNFALGNDGRIYGGTYPHAKLGALNLDTYEVEDCGAPAPPNLYLRDVSELPDGRIFCHFGMQKQTRLIYDPWSKVFSEVSPEMNKFDRGVLWNDYFIPVSSLDSSAADPKVFHGASLEPEAPPFPLPPKDRGAWVVSQLLTTRDVLCIQQGKTIWSYRAGDKALTEVCTADLQGGGINAITSDGTVVGLNGQSYMVLKPGEKEFALRRYPIELSPRVPHFLRSDNAGKLWGGPTFGQTIFWLDINSKKFQNTDRVCNSGGEVYDAAFLDGKVYTVSYVGGDICRYDPSVPWDQRNNVNPKSIVHVADRGYIRPEAGIVLGPDKKLYSGWAAKYGTYGGAVSITDPGDGKTELIENPLGDASICGVAVDDKFVYAGTTTNGNGLPARKDLPAKFGVIDRQTKKVVFEKAFDGKSFVRQIVRDASSGLIAMMVGDAVLVFDPGKRSFISVPKDLPKRTGDNLCAPGDGNLYFASAKEVVALELMSMKFQTIGSAPDKIEKLAVEKTGAVYVACGPRVYRVRDGK